MPSTPKMSRMKKRDVEYPTEEALETANNQSLKLQYEYIILAEEQERQRRIAFDRDFEVREKLDSLLNRVYTQFLEEQERARRIDELLELKRSETKPQVEQETKQAVEQETKQAVEQETPKGIEQPGVSEKTEEEKELEEERKDDLAYVHIKEEEERARRIAEDSYIEEVNEEQRKDNIAWTVVAEEEEKTRRISENQYLDELEKEQSEVSRAYSRIKEEEEKVRRVSNEEYLDELEQSYRAEDRAWVTVAVEEERDRRIALGPPSAEILFKIKSVGESAAKVAQEKLEKAPQKPLRRSGGRLRKSGNGQPKAAPVSGEKHTTWQKKMRPKTTEGVLEPKEETTSKSIEPQISGKKSTTSQHLQSLLQEQQKVFDERKALIDRMSTELFERIARKVRGGVER